MKKILCVILICIFIINITGCKTVIYESKSNLVTKINETGIFITTEQYLELIDKKGITKPKPIPEAIGKYYMPDKYFIIKEDGKVYLNTPKEISQ